MWTTTGRGSWTGGFWAGLLWLRAKRSGGIADLASARACTQRLTRWSGADTAARGLILWYGTVCAEPEQRDAIRAEAARACLGSFERELGIVPWGSAFGGPRLVARVDGVPGMVPLLATMDPDAARCHLRTHLRLCLDDRPPHWSWQHIPGTGWTALTDPHSGWSRGPAWLLLAAAEAVRHADEPELGYLVAELTNERLVPLADAAQAHGPVDTSAAAITALALLTLGRTERALPILERLVEEHLTVTGRLLDGCYDLQGGTAVRHELVWGTFFLTYALALLTGLAGPEDL